MKKLLFIGMLTLVACAESGWAQVTGVLSGRVVDATDAGIPGATVTVKTVDTDATRTTTTDERGAYRIVSVPVGQQEVRAEKNGFKTSVRLGINLAVGQEAVANLRLEVGTVSEKVTVTADTPLVNTTTAAISGLVDERQIKELPLNGRSFDNLMTLNPGIIDYVLKSPSTSTSNRKRRLWPMFGGTAASISPSSTRTATPFHIHRRACASSKKAMSFPPKASTRLGCRTRLDKARRSRRSETGRSIPSQRLLSGRGRQRFRTPAVGCTGLLCARMERSQLVGRLPRLVQGSWAVRDRIPPSRIGTLLRRTSRRRNLHSQRTIAARPESFGRGDHAEQSF